VSSVQMQTTAGQSVRVSLERLPSKFPFIAFMPQWDFLEFMTRQAMRFPTFTLLRNAEVIDLLQKDGQVTGVRYRDAAGEHELDAVLTIGADGRTARTRDAADLPRLETSPPIDVFWFRLPRHSDEVAAVFGRIGPGLLLVMLDRNDYWQVAFVFPKGKGDAMKDKGAMKDTSAMKDKGAMKDSGAMKDKGAMKDSGAMKDDGDKMGKH